MSVHISNILNISRQKAYFHAKYITEIAGYKILTYKPAYKFPNKYNAAREGPAAFKLYSRRYCTVPALLERQKCAIFRNKWSLHIEAIRTFVYPSLRYEIITNISQLSPHNAHSCMYIVVDSTPRRVDDLCSHCESKKRGIIKRHNLSILAPAKYRKCQLSVSIGDDPNL